jgi:16S rRNA G966 N2-methylase RsmD
MSHCQCMKINGDQCQRLAKTGSKFCFQHANCKTVIGQFPENKPPNLVLKTIPFKKQNIEKQLAENKPPNLVLKTIPFKKQNIEKQLAENKPPTLVLKTIPFVKKSIPILFKKQKIEKQLAEKHKTEKQLAEKQLAEKQLAEKHKTEKQLAEKQLTNKQLLKKLVPEDPAKEYTQKIQLNYFFEPLKSIPIWKIKMTNISLYSVTPWQEANQISDKLIGIYQNWGVEKSLISLTDATANVGGNLISFHNQGVIRLNAVEYEPLTCQFLQNNLHVYKIPFSSGTGGVGVNVYCGDYTQIYDQLQQDVVFLDPPWGGSSYKLHKVLDLYLGSTNVIDLCVQLFQKNKVSMIVYKVPINYNFNSLMKSLPNLTFDILEIKRKNKYGTNHSYSVIYMYRPID